MMIPSQGAKSMRKVLTLITSAVLIFVAGMLFATRIQTVHGKGSPGEGFAAVPSQKGGWDLTGPYEVVRDWPKPMTTLPDHDGWSWGSVEGVFAESPNRVLIAQRGELPVVRRPPQTPLPQFGPGLSFPVGQVPFRNASQGPVAALPGGGAPGQLAEDAEKNWHGRMGVDARWEDNIVAVDAQGNITERWTQWDKMLKRPHAIYIGPYDPEKRVWIVDDFAHAIYIFSNDGKKLLQTIGTPGKLGADATHFHRPTFIAWLPDGTFFVADGYNGTRVAKFDKTGKFLLDWGMKGTPPDTHPGYFNVVHGLAVDPASHRVYVSDRGNRRMQVFDENGKFLDQWPFAQPSSVNFLFVSASHQIWAFDDTTSKVVRYDPQGHLLYAWGALGDYPGGLFNMHGASVDQEGNLYVAEVANGRVQKFKPRQGANPEFLVGKPVYAAWK
jgi:DNA-binding beta-propeller fold protein YncE